MAEMHPVDIENYNYTPSEKYIYKSFRDRLDKNIISFIRSDGSKQKKEKESILFLCFKHYDTIGGVLYGQYSVN